MGPGDEGGVQRVLDMVGCQKYGPFLSTLNIRCGIKLGIQKGTRILTTTPMG